MEPPATVRRFVSTLVDDVAGDAELCGVYVHGSAVLGDWRGDVSDVVLLVVVAGASPSMLDRLATVLASPRPCPGVGLEASVVADSAARRPSAPWPFLVHVTTAEHDRKIVSGREREGDADLVLHYLVTRDAGGSAYGPAARDTIGPVADTAVLAQLATELRWAVAHASESYAVLNACRAMRYCEDRTVCSKTAAGRWALQHEIEPELVGRALDQRRSGAGTAVSNRAAAFVSAACDRVADTRYIQRAGRTEGG